MTIIKVLSQIVSQILDNDQLSAEFYRNSSKKLELFQNDHLNALLKWILFVRTRLRDTKKSQTLARFWPKFFPNFDKFDREIAIFDKSS